MFPEINLILGKVGTFNLCAGMGLLSMVCLSMWQTRCLGMDRRTEQFFLQSIPFVTILSIIPACLSDIIFRWPNFKENHLGFGMTFYGWLLGCIFGWSLYALVAKMKACSLLNFFCPTLALAQAFGRIGCFLAGCCHGRPTGCCIGLRFPEHSMPWKQYGNSPIYPVQLIDAIWLFSATVILFWIIPFKNRMGCYFIFIGGGRFFTEFLRGDNRGVIFENWHLSPAQILSLIFVATGVVLIMRNRKESKLWQ